ncbi:hypothetical protein ACQKOE_14495 [Novosphingobium sp. NPDC080210]|uniref:hypothetical protein n=1 Tax=Novosphingobium sp. NPDC080210 TaxID=3390596 RepID=UPI003CFF88C7
MFHEITRNPIRAARKSVLTGGASGLAFAAAFAATPALAAPCGTVQGVYAPCDGATTPGSGDFTNNSEIISTTDYDVPAIDVQTGVNIGVLNNSYGARIVAQGAGGIGLRSSGRIGILDNFEQIYGTSYAVEVTQSGVMSTINNNGNILAQNTGLFVNGGFIGALNNIGRISANSGIYNAGQIDRIANSGTIFGTGANAISNDRDSDILVLLNNAGGNIDGRSKAIYNGGTISELTNHGTITASGTTGIRNLANIVTLTNSGTIAGAVHGIWNINSTFGQAVITMLDNSGTIRGDSQVGIINEGGAAIGTLINRAGGLITGGLIGLRNLGTITTLNNAGTLTAPTGIANERGTIATLTNSGVISGEANFGISNTGRITNLVNRETGEISGGSFGILNLISIESLTNHGVIRGNEAGLFTSTASYGTITNSETGLISSGKIAFHLNRSTVTTLTNQGTISSSYQAIFSNGTVTTLDNAGTVTGGTYAIENYSGNGSTGNIATLRNSGTIRGTASGIFNNGGTIGSITNSGTIAGISDTGIFNSGGSMGTITNEAAGKITGGTAGVYNSALLTSLINHGAIGGANYGFYNNSEVTSITNSGTISGATTYGLYNDGGDIGAIANSGTISGGTYGLYSWGGSIGSISNSGSIDGGLAGMRNQGATITSLTNSGTITGGQDHALWNEGVIETLTNTGTIGSKSSQYGIYNKSGRFLLDGRIGTLTNSGTITGSNTAVYNFDGIGTLTNRGTIESPGIGMRNYRQMDQFTNEGTISGAYAVVNQIGYYTVDGVDRQTRGQITSLVNSGSIEGDSVGLQNAYDSSIGNLLNSGTISGGTSIGLSNGGTIDQLTNTGTISGGSTGIFNNGTIGTLVNSGEIASSSNATGTIYNNVTIGTLSNLGTISGGSNGIYNRGTIDALRNFGVIEQGLNNAGTINTLVNGQGGAGGGGAIAPLVLSDRMITGGYTAHITSPSHYGQLVYTGGEGVLAAFGLTGESVLEKGTYQDLLSGIATVNGPLTGTLGRYQWSLVADAATAGNWDLLVIRLGPDAVNSLLALGLSRDEIMTALANRAARITNLLSTDCGSFGSAGLCLSAELRRLEHRDESETSMALSAGLRITGNLRVGAFVDLPINRKSRLAGLSTDQDTVSYGGFVGYSQKGDGSGLQARLVGAVHAQDVTITRAADLADTEAGRGQSRFKTWALAGELGYAFAVAPGNRIMPTIGLRHVRAARAAYAEAAASEVEFPFTYGAYGLRTTTAQAGVTAQGDLGGRLSYRVSTGVEWDLASRSDAFAGTSQVDDLPSFALSPAGSGRRFRGNGSVELGYEFTRGARITLGGALRGEAFTNQIITNLTAGIRIGF